MAANKQEVDAGGSGLFVPETGDADSTHGAIIFGACSCGRAASGFSEDLKVTKDRKNG